MNARDFSQRGSRMMLATIAEKPREHCPTCGFIVYRNQAPVAVTVIEHGQHLVLVRRRHAPLAGYWAPPAGRVETGESAPEAVIREAMLKMEQAVYAEMRDFNS